jgi:NAD+ diphosphatase
VFIAGVTSTATAGRRYLVSGQALCVAEDATIPTGPVGADWLYLGALDDVACFACTLADGEAPPPGTTARPLRQLYGVLGDDDFGIAARALGLTTWDRDHRWCGRCGTPTERSATERSRICPSCQHASYPRISPAVIVAVERDGRLLLARNARTKSPFHSVLAGFVEVGESLEECVARELFEESGITVEAIRYFGSQPWPLTSSLMVGFTARWASGELVPDETEIFEAGWFGPDELPTLPGRLSIARALVDDFVARHAGK